MLRTAVAFERFRQQNTQPTPLFDLIDFNSSLDLRQIEINDRLLAPPSLIETNIFEI